MKKKMTAVLLSLTCSLSLVVGAQAPANAAIEWWNEVYTGASGATFGSNDDYRAVARVYWRNGFRPNKVKVGKAPVKMIYSWSRQDGEDIDCPDGNYFTFRTRIYDYYGHDKTFRKVTVDCDESGWNEKTVRFKKKVFLRYGEDGTPVMRTRIKWHNTFSQDQIESVGQRLWYMGFGAFAEDK